MKKSFIIFMMVLALNGCGLKRNLSLPKDDKNSQVQQNNAPSKTDPATPQPANPDVVH